MSYAAFETSVQAGEPVELLRFTSGLRTWTYTSGDVPFVHLSATYEPYPFTHDEPQQTVEVAKGRLELRTPIDTPIVADLVASPLLAVTDLVIYRRHRGDAEVIPWWHGEVQAVVFEGPEAKLTCVQLGSALRRVGRQRPAQRQCPHALFDSGCGLSRAAFTTTGTLISATAATMVSGTFASQPDGWWVGGIFEAGNTQRMVLAHTSDTITLSSGIPGLALGAAFNITPGDDHTPETCNSKFGNILNYGGLPWLPVKNPFSGDNTF